MTIQDAEDRRPSAGAVEPGERLDALVPGLADACVDLFDAVYDRVDEAGPGRAVLLARLGARLAPLWSAASPDERVLALLDAMRMALGVRADDQPPGDLV